MIFSLFLKSGSLHHSRDIHVCCQAKTWSPQSDLSWKLLLLRSSQAQKWIVPKSRMSFDKYNETRKFFGANSYLVHGFSRHAYNAMTRDSALQMSKNPCSAEVLELKVSCAAFGWRLAFSGSSMMTNRGLGTTTILRAGSDISKLVRRMLENGNDTGAN